MAKYSNTVHYDIKTTLDSSGIAQLQAQIRQVQNELQRLASQKLISQPAMEDAKDKIQSLRNALETSFNSKLGMLDMTQFSKSLSNAKISIGDLRTAFATAGTVGNQAFVSTIGQLGKLDTNLNTVSKTTDKIFNTLGNTARWGIIASGFQGVLNSVHEASQYVKDLDTSLTNIMMVTDYSKDQMYEYANAANEAAKNLNSTTVAMTDATLVFAQQGFDLPQASQLAEMSTQLANVSQQDTATTSDQITAYMNAYGMDDNMEALSSALDSWAKVANVSAADVEELATASQKAASTANTVGVNMDQLAAQIATIESVTREAPENIGNGLKTIYARLSDIGMGETMEDGVDLGVVTKQLEQVGVAVLDSEGKMRNVGDIMEDLMDVWSSMDTTQKAAVGATLAGKYQLSRFEALMNRSDLYAEYKDASLTANGEMDKMQEVYADSLEGRLNKLQATAEGIFNDLFNSSDFYGMIDALTAALDLMNQFVDAIGGGTTALTGLGAVATRVFSNNIASGLSNFVSNRDKQSLARQNRQNALSNLQDLGLDTSSTDSRVQDLINFTEQGLAHADQMSEDQRISYNKQVERSVNLLNQQLELESKLVGQAQLLNLAAAEYNNTTDKLSDYGDLYNIPFDEKGQFLDSIIQQGIVTESRDEKGRFKTKDYESIFGIEREKTLEGISNLTGNENFQKKISLYVDDIVTQVKEADSVLNSFKKDGQVSFDTVKASVESANESLKEFYMNMRSNTSNLSDMKMIADNLDNALRLDESKEGINQVSNELGRLKTLMISLQEAVDSPLTTSPSIIEGLQDSYSKNQAQLMANQGSNNLMQEQWIRQEQINNVINAAGAVGQLAFSWQSFQSLGSLWANSDIDGGEKLSQTITNLLINLPMLISGFADLSQIGKTGAFNGIAKNLENIAKQKTGQVVAQNFSSLTDVLDEVIRSGARATVTTEVLSAKARVAGGAANVAAKGVRALGAALSWLGGPAGIAAMIAITGISSVLSGISAANEQAYSDSKTKAEDAVSGYSEIESQVSNFNTLYNDYKETGTASEEFRSSAQELADTLGVQGSNALIATDNFGELASRIEEADAQQRKYAKEDIQSFLAGSNADSLRGGIGNGSIYQDLRGAISAGQGSEMWSTRQDYLGKITKAEADSDPAKAIGAINNLINEYNSEIEDLDEQIKQKSLENQDTTDLDNLKQQYLANIDKLNSVLNTEDIADYLAQSQTLAELEAKDLKFDENSDIQSIVQQFQENDNINGFLETFTSWSDQLAWMIQNTSDEAAKLKLEAEQAQMGLTEEAYTSRIDNGASEEDANAYADEIYQKIEDSGISDEDLVKIKASIDGDYLLENIDSIIEQLNNGSSVDEIVLKYKLENQEMPNSNYLSDSEIAETLGDLELETSDLENYQDALIANSETFSEYNDRIEENKRSLEDQIRTVEKQKKASEEAGESTEDQEKELRRLTQELNDSDDALDSMTAMLLESAKGAEELSEVYDDAESVLKDTTSSTYEQTEAVNSLVPGLEHLLNLDMSSWSQDMKNDFVVQNLNDIRDAINGDVYALQRLRGEAAQRILIEAGVDPNSDVAGEMSSIIAWANANLPDLQAGASINDATFIAQLNHMIQSAYDAGQDVSAILEAISELGIDANVNYKTVSVKTPQIDTSNFKAANTGKGVVADTTGGILSSSISYKDMPMQLPTVELGDLTYRGGSSGYTPSSPVGKGSGGGGGGGKKGGGGSGGSGGSGSSYEPKTKDPIEEEIDRYERVNTLIDAVANDLDRVATEQDRLAGFEVIDNMEKQIDLIQRQIELQKEKLSIQQQEQKELRNSLASDYGIQFDAEGFITNYATVHQRLTDEVNRLINQYNATTTEAGQESLEEQIEKAQDRLDDFKDDYQRYDELVSSDMKDTLQTLEDLEDQIEDLRIEAFETSVEAADNIKDIQEALNEFNQIFSGLKSDDPFRQMALSVSNLIDYFDVATDTVDEFYDELIARTEEQMKTATTDAQKAYLQSQIDQMKAAQEAFGNQTMEEYGTGYLDMAMSNLQNILDQINQYEQNGTSSIFGEDAGDLYEVAKDVFDQTTEMIEDYESEIDDLRDAILDAIDEIADEMDRRIEQYENITDELEHQRDIIELIHGDEAYTQLNEALAAQQNNYRAQINEMQQQLDIWKDMQTAMEEGSEEWLAIQELITDTQSDLNDLVQESLENLQEQYENTVNKIMNSWVENALGTDLDWMNDQWELINRNADYYLDDVNAAYEIQKLQGDYLELLDGSNDVQIQQMITEQMKQQLGYLRDKEKISEYDVAYAQAQLEILQKRIALEDAQRNKSQMKLRRDSQGNYSYVYTADEGDVANAQGDLLDAQNNAYNLSKEQMKQTQDDSLSALSDAQQMLNDIWTNANLTLEEKQERTRTIIDSLKEYLEGTSEQLSTSEKNIINDFIGMVEMMTDENSERLDDVYNQIINGNIDAFDQIDTRWSTSLTQWLQNLEDFNNSTDDMFGSLVDNATDYQDQIDEVGDLVETDFNDMSDAIQNTVDKTNDLANSTSDFINQLKNDAGTIKEYENILQDYADKISDVTNEMKAYQEQVNELANKLTAKEQENANLQSQIKDLQNQINGTNGSGGSGAGGSGSLANGIQVGDWVGYTGKYYYDSWGRSPAGSWGAGNKGAVKVDSYSAKKYGGNAKSTGDYNVHITGSNGWDLGWVKPSQLFDTGGYTGSWSDGNKEAKDGKLAFLHQKEIVLNDSDTENLLAAVKVVRQLTQSLKDSAIQNDLFNLSNLKISEQKAKEIEQNVHITAEFPNANNAIEIEQALLSLNDRAIQYSFKQV